MAQTTNEQVLNVNAVLLNSSVLRVQQDLLSLGSVVTQATQSFSQLVAQQSAALKASEVRAQPGNWSAQRVMAQGNADFNDTSGYMLAGLNGIGTDQSKDKTEVKTWRDGLIESWSEYAKVASDTYTQVKTGGEAVFKTLDAGLTRFVKTGKLNLSNFAESMLSMLANVALRASMVEGVNAILGFFDISTTTKDKDKDKDQGKNKQSTSSNPATTVAQRNDTQKSNNNQEGGESNNHIGKTWVDGLSESWGKYSESALDSYSIIQAGGDAAFQQLDNSVMNFVRTGKLNFSSFAESVLGMLAEIAVKSALVQGVNALMGAFGVTANAKGGVYTSSSLSAYSGQVVDRPTLFAFAKGAGLMGEAGPEAIMPLTRNANGVLGVRAVGGVSGNTAPQVSINIASDGRISQTSSAGLAQFGSEIGSFVDQRFKSLLTREMGQGRMLSTAMKGRRS
ncbi:phage tail tape measure protein [Candidatus Symbiopectobacterium sp. NZEC151]|uniref:phage tail tape measure protein n=1 Tax=Candidatus Symbiopectobacterium sp. NZEC151 TaxID=2820470 RepID=UPI0022269E18|nr:phage tail tape measure protein [Candidatus Symbiopectobacterium sp. NZEC151]